MPRDAEDGGEAVSSHVEAGERKRARSEVRERNAAIRTPDEQDAHERNREQKRLEKLAARQLVENATAAPEPTRNHLALSSRPHVKNQFNRLNALVDTTVVLDPTVLREKRHLPSTRLQVVSIKRNRERFGVCFKGTSTVGEAVSYTDWISAVQDPAERYRPVTGEQDMIPLQPQTFEAFFISCTEAHAAKAVPDSTALPLLSILPKFCFEVDSPFEKNILCLGDSHEAELQQLLVHRSQLFFDQGRSEKQGRILRAQTADGVTFETDVEAVRVRAREVLHIEKARDDVFVGRTDLPPGLSRVGNAALWPWQAWFYAEFLCTMVHRPETPRELLVKRQWKNNWVLGLSCLPHRLRICVANPGDGKTRVGCLCAAGRKTCVVVTPGMVRHWEREAELVGIRTLHIGNGGWKPEDVKQRLADTDETMMWIVTRPVLETYFRRPSARSTPAKRHIGLFPIPDLLIVDEFHDPPLHAITLLETWPEAIILGFSGTFSPCEVREVAQELQLDEDVLEASSVRLPLDVIRGKFPSVETQVIRVDMSPLERACYQAGRSWMRIEDRQRLLIFSPKARQRASPEENYGQEIWETIVQEIKQAEGEVFAEIAKILSHVVGERRLQALKKTIQEELGEEVLNKLLVSVANLTSHCEGAVWAPGDVEKRVQAAFTRRQAIIGGYVYLRRQLADISTGSTQYCNVCLESSLEWRMANCGHLVCEPCYSEPTVRLRCPTCRARAPSWKTATELDHIRKETDTAPPSPKKAELDTSNKLKRLASILLGLGSSQRALVICPAQRLQVVADEMRRVGVELGVLAGSSQEQERTQAAWAAGKRYRGLLAAPGILGVDVYASTIICLGPIPKRDKRHYRQALARVKRQGNPAKVISQFILVYPDTEEDCMEDLQEMISIAQEDANTPVRAPPGGPQVAATAAASSTSSSSSSR